MVEAEQNDGNTGTFTDPRDGKTYKTVKIGSQIWMAENLNYEFFDSYSVDDDPDNDEKYGRLYTWKAARVAYPDGWHIPSREEWDELEKFVADTLFRGDKDYVGYALKSASGWKENDKGKPGNGSDAFGFGALPAGRRDGGGTFVGVLNYAHFWCSSDYSANDAYGRNLSCLGTGLDTDDYHKDNALSVRCVKDQ